MNEVELEVFEALGLEEQKELLKPRMDKGHSIVWV